MAKSKSVGKFKQRALQVVGVLLALFVLAGSGGGVYAYYQLYFASTGVQLNDGTPLKRADLLDMVLISAVKQAQEQNAAQAHETSLTPTE